MLQVLSLRACYKPEPISIDVMVSMNHKSTTARFTNNKVIANTKGLSNMVYTLQMNLTTILRSLGADLI